MLAYGELVAMVSPKGKVYVKRLKKGRKFHFHEGIISCDDLVGRPDACMVTTSLGKKFYIYRPTLIDFIMSMPRKSNIIYPKDISMIVLWADIYPGCRVFTAGAGSGALLLALARAAGNNGTVFACDNREDMLHLCRQNIEDFLGPRDNVVLFLGDVYQEVDYKNLDRVILDVPEPWRALGPVADAMDDGGILVAYVPTIGQAEQFYRAVEEREDYAFPEVMEVLFRTWHVGEISSRPNHRMVGHTGFLCRAFKIHPLD